MVLGLGIREHLFNVIPQPTSSFKGQTIIVTGGNRGLGIETARHIANLNAAKIILAVRDESKGTAARKSIIDSCTTSCVIEVWQLDLSSYDSVKAFAKRAQKLERLDCIIHNAGIAVIDFATHEKDEASITINVVSPMLLTFLLLPKLQATAAELAKAPTRISIVTSEWHTLVKLPRQNILSDLDNPQKANMVNRYNETKLMGVFAARALAQHLSAPNSPYSDVVVNLVNPGNAKTGIIDNLHGFFRLLMVIIQTFLARTPEHSARGMVYAAAAGRESHGQYMAFCKVGESVFQAF
jgi:retinol dehydrogenase-12